MFFLLKFQKHTQLLCPKNLNWSTFLGEKRLLHTTVHTYKIMYKGDFYLLFTPMRTEPICLQITKTLRQ